MVAAGNRRPRPAAFTPRRLLQVSATLASAAWLLSRDSSSAAFTLPARGARSTLVARRAEEDAVLEVSAMEAAEPYSPQIDQMTGELEVNDLPNDMGVYAVYDVADKLQYIGLSRDIRKSVGGHGQAIGIAEVESLVCTVKCLVLPGQGKEALKGTWERWIKDHMEAGGEIPPGNLPENAPGADPRWRNKKQTKPALDLGGAKGITTPQEAMMAVEKAIKGNPVLLFMKGSPAMPQCGFSAKTIGMLGQIGVPFEAVNVLDEEANKGVRDAVKEFGQWPTIPQLYVNGELVGGCDIITELHESGDLAAQLRAAVNGGSSQSKESDESGAEDDGNPLGPIDIITDERRPTASLMSRTLDENFSLRMLLIQDDSAAHEGDAGALEMGLTSESHFRVEIVAPEFDGMSPVQRQKKVFEALSEVMPKVHALSLVTKTPAEVLQVAR